VAHVDIVVSSAISGHDKRKRSRKLRLRKPGVVVVAVALFAAAKSAAPTARSVAPTACKFRCRIALLSLSDEYAPLKAAKQLRRGKRISEIEMLYGKSATDAALASQGEDADRPQSPTGRRFERIPELTHEFFDSAFFRRFHVQRKLCVGSELNLKTPYRDPD